MTFRSITLICAALVVVAAGVYTFTPEATASNTVVAESASSEQTQRFAIAKMNCATCPITVRKAMQKVDGVRSVTVDFNAKTATVVFDPALTSPEQIAAASSHAGYPATAMAGR